MKLGSQLKFSENRIGVNVWNIFRAHDIHQSETSWVKFKFTLNLISLTLVIINLMIYCRLLTIKTLVNPWGLIFQSKSGVIWRMPLYAYSHDLLDQPSNLLHWIHGNANQNDTGFAAHSFMTTNILRSFGNHPIEIWCEKFL